MLLGLSAWWGLAVKSFSEHGHAIDEVMIVLDKVFDLGLFEEVGLLPIFGVDLLVGEFPFFYKLIILSLNILL